MMTPRERYNAIMDFKKPDKIPWAEIFDIEPIFSWLGTHLPTLEIIKPNPGCDSEQQLVNFQSLTPADIEYINPYPFFGCIPAGGFAAPVDMCPIPRFPTKIVEDTETYIEQAVNTGVHVRLSKRAPYVYYAMPMFRNWPVKDQESWEEYKKRLNPMNPRRLPKDWDPKEYREMFKNYQAGPTRIFFDAFFGFGAQTMGIERFIVMFYEDPDLVHEMADFWEFYTIECFRPVLDAFGEYIDATWWWEDMAERHGPFISPKIYEEFMLPHYKRVTRFFRKKGIKHIMMDSDGDINPIMDLMIEAGIDGTWPCEVNANMDARKIREKYEKFWVSGNIDKREAILGGERMRKEVDSKLAVAEELGGYAPGIDHLVSAEFTFEKFKEYVDYMKLKLSY